MKMARRIYFAPSRTLKEFRLLPGLTSSQATLDKVSLSTNLAIKSNSTVSSLSNQTSSNEQLSHEIAINIPIISAAMQSVSGEEMGISLAKHGGLAFIYCSQKPRDQLQMIQNVKAYNLSEMERKNFPLALTSKKDGKLLTGAAVNTHDYKERIPILMEGGVDVLLVDSSDGHSFYQGDLLDWCRAHYPQQPIIGGNVITAEGFQFLVEAGAWAVKVGMGNGSICTTQEEKGTGRGQATSLLEIEEERRKYFDKSGHYLPIISDGGITSDRDIIIALAIGADAVMMGRYFARTKESPTPKILKSGKVTKPYWGEGSFRARQWRLERYHQVDFEEGVEGFVEYAGSIDEVLPKTLSKIRSALSTAGAASIRELHQVASLELVSSHSAEEGRVHNVLLSD